MEESIRSLHLHHMELYMPFYFDERTLDVAQLLGHLTCWDIIFLVRLGINFLRVCLALSQSRWARRSSTHPPCPTPGRLRLVAIMATILLR